MMTMNEAPDRLLDRVRKLLAKASGPVGDGSGQATATVRYLL